MANPESPNTLNYWITDQIGFDSTSFKGGSTGNLDTWITDQLSFGVYAQGSVFPFSDDFTGSTGNPWDTSKWVTSVEA